MYYTNEILDYCHSPPIKYVTSTMIESSTKIESGEGNLFSTANYSYEQLDSYPQVSLGDQVADRQPAEDSLNLRIF